MPATYAVARGWVEFWLCRIAVDLGRRPELLYFHCFAAFVTWGFVVWLRISRSAPPARLSSPRSSPSPDVAPAA